MEMTGYLFRKIPKLRNIYLYGFQRLFKYLYFYDEVRIMDEEWDYLIVLDACRYDYFKRYNDIEGKLERKISLGSSTGEWVRKNFPGKYPDVVYVSANPFVSRVKLRQTFGRYPFFHVDEVWDYGWNERFKTVLPDVVTESILRNLEDYPSKRIIGHYIQPHHPFIGDRTLLIEEGGWAHTRSNVKGERNNHPKHIWYYVENRKVSIERVKEGYIRNLKLVLKEVKRLLERLEGKIVITSDHGNCFGEYWTYGHPGGVYIRPLRMIPWLVIEKMK